MSILAIAAALRMVYPGIIDLWYDETNVLYKAVMLARHGQWTWIGNPISTDSSLFHSPLSVYVAAIPYLFTTNAIVARLVFGVLGVFTTASIYGLVRRYYSQRAALLAMALLAVSPLPVYWSRFVWNPNLAPPFIVLWMVTGLLGYYENKRWAQVVHWLMLSGLIQSQTALIIMLPFSGLLLLFHWWRGPSPAIYKAKTFLLIVGVLGLSLIPWFIGLYGVNQGWITSDEVCATPWTARTNQIGLPDFDLLARNIGLLAGSYDYHLNTLAVSDFQARWWPNKQLNYAFAVQTIMVVIGSLVLLWRGWRTRHLPDLFLAGVFWWPFLYQFHDQRHIPEFYMMPAGFAAPVLFGVAFSRMEHRRWLHRSMMLAAVVFIMLQGWLTLAILNRQQRSDQIFSLSELQNLMQDWVQNGGEIVVLDETAGITPAERRVWRRKWRILGEQFPIRTATQPYAFPIAPQGQTLVSTIAGDTIPTLFGPGESLTTIDRDFRWIVVSPSDLPQPNYLPSSVNHFMGIASVAGIAAESSPQAGNLWSFAVIWTPLQTPAAPYHFSARLVDKAGATYGQIDAVALEPELWRSGDVVITRLEMSISEALPAATQLPELHVDLLLYEWPSIANVPVADADGHITGIIMTLDPAP